MKPGEMIVLREYVSPEYIGWTHKALEEVVSEAYYARVIKKIRPAAMVASTLIFAMEGEELLCGRAG